MGDLSTIVGLMGAGICTLSAAVARLWTVFHAELTDCKKDRKELFAVATETKRELQELRDYVNEIREGKQPPIA